MYAVVGCRDCGAYWVVSGRPETTQCRRCGARRRFEQLHRFVETDDEDAAREARARLLAERSGETATFDDIESFAALEADVDAGVISDETYLEGNGIDPDAVAAAGDRATAGHSSPNRREVVTTAIRALDDPTTDDIIAYAAERGVSEEFVRPTLARLVRRGDATRSGDRYRLL